MVAAGASADRDAARAMFARLREALSAGDVRAAEPDASSPVGWRVNAWVKQGILLGFRFGDTVDVSMDHGRWPFFDKDTLPMKKFAPGSNVRIVPGGSSVRDGAYIAARRHLHAADVREHRRVDRRGVAHRFARARRLVRAGRRARAHQRGRADWRRHRAGRRAAGHRRRRGAGRRQHGHLRRRHRQGARRDRGGHRAHRIDARCTTWCAARSSSRRPIGRSSCPKARSSCPARAPSRRARAGVGLSLATPVIVKYRDSRTDTRTELEAWIR